MLVVVGCGQFSNEYGRSSGPNATSSLNGFGLLRSAYEIAGFQTRDVRRLSDRVNKADVIVWTPQMLGVDRYESHEVV